ncbi:glycosyltransferase family 2 protein [Pontibacter amylolyticus]|uniref:Glycosyltransferase 2-like domain-containing protein n=1 Tax=Pontibacter amylolyticus TaxID=1424080 RepID=A0ABQ1W3I6_9BACT|nr:glycosyltransferase family 2 protein [Pontibacter amylolyticus]GGG12492.1 hypothetical protein GCM10011323_16170 [Pontibacter amylolyticus]
MISIIIPTYNRIDALKRCVNSLRNQLYDGMEVVIIDDFSQDSTKTYLKSLKDHSNFIKIIFNKENRGVNFSRNRGIEAASKKFILFLDSDDELVPGGLSLIAESINSFKEVNHFLFLVSYRSQEYKTMIEPTYVEYRDWITGELKGDFTHVVRSEIMKQYLFYERFRMFEFLNWYRVFRTTSPQLIIPHVTTKIELNRSDSLTSNTQLTNKSIISNTFDAQSLYYQLYRFDIQHYNPGMLTYGLLKTILLGIASNKKEECNTLISYAEKAHIKLLGQFLTLLPSFLIRRSIITYSQIKKSIAFSTTF